MFSFLELIYRKNRLGYSNGIEMFFETTENLPEVLILTEHIFKKFNLHINVSETKTMVFDLNCDGENSDQY